ncbi:MAG: hypothetical protein MSB96_04755, partial [Subdoligranulum sp.]|nr:hypothetical protein [Subdoligranulum sp.]
PGTVPNHCAEGFLQSNAGFYHLIPVNSVPFCRETWYNQNTIKHAAGQHMQQGALCGENGISL